TLFGRNATGGAINLVTNKPDLRDAYGSIEGEYGDYQDERLRGMVNIPVNDRFGLRFAGTTLQRDGYIDNTADGQVGAAGTRGAGEQIAHIQDTQDGRDLYAWRATALWDVTDDLKAWVQYNKFYENDDRVRITNQVCH